MLSSRDHDIAEYHARMAMIELLGHPTWARLPKKRRTTVVLLHGGMSSSVSMLRSIGPGLSRHFEVAAFDRRGHGRTSDTDAPFHYDDMASETIAFLEYLDRRVHLVGHSDGGNIALLVAMRRPDLLRRVAVIGANFHFDGLVPQDDFRADSPEFDDWAVKYAKRSPDGIDHARVVLEKTLQMFKNEPQLSIDDLATIENPVLVMAGDDDVATLAHTCSLYEALRDGQLAIVPAASHAVLKEHTKESVRILSHFLKSASPVTTYAPLRRLGRVD
jgi:pimeloyl-ACP methyl ester carboxylesterase